MLSPRVVLAVLVLATLVNISPFLWLFEGGGDSFLHYTYISCFAGQLWQGDLYPRWCMEANNGLGAPLFLFYFPLPYYVASIFYPLTFVGASIQSVFVIGMALATFFSGLTCYVWLKHIVRPPRALLAAILFLFIPYRMEAMFFRAAYAEIWCMALLPLMLLYARRIVQRRPGANPKLSACVALGVLTHLPTTMVGLMMAGIYVLALGQARSVLNYITAVVIAAALTAFYWWPAFYYKQFMFVGKDEASSEGWPNRYLQMANLTQMHQYSVVALISISIAALLGVFIFVMRRRDKSVMYIPAQKSALGG